MHGTRNLMSTSIAAESGIAFLQYWCWTRWNGNLEGWLANCRSRELAPCHFLPFRKWGPKQSHFHHIVLSLVNARVCSQVFQKFSLWKANAPETHKENFIWSRQLFSAPKLPREYIPPVKWYTLMLHHFNHQNFHKATFHQWIWQNHASYHRITRWLVCIIPCITKNVLS